jgi:hypothetical protein
MSIIESHLGIAILAALRSCGDTGGWVSREVFSAALAEDEWVQRNPHRLARLDSSLAGLAREGYLEINGGRLRFCEQA